MNTSPPLSNAQYCAEQVRAQDADRYLIALFQPKRLRQAALALAAWNLELANARPRSGETAIGMIRLQWHRDALAEIVVGNPRRQPVIGALADAHAAGLIDAGSLTAIIDARERDLDPASPADLPALEAYARSTSGLLHRSLWQGTPQAIAAEDAGTAFALIGLARAEPVNQARGRPWMPKALALDMRPIVERAEDLARMRAPTGVKAPAVLATAYARRARKADFDPTTPAMAAPDPWRIWRLLAARIW